MKNMRTYIFLFIATSAFGVSCEPDPVFPEEPIITFKEYIYNGSDTLKVVFTFTDGDGDIGVAPTGNDSNMVLTLYYKAPDGQFHVARPPADTIGDSIYYPYRIPELVEGQSGLEGDIYLVVNPQFMLYDTIQFNAFLLDQSDNKSAVVRTPETIVN
jgi:hypothetical protein